MLRPAIAFLFLGLAAAAPGGAADLGTGRLLVAGTRLTISPEAQTVPFNTPTIVETQLEGFDPGGGASASGLRVVADFTGPEIDGVLELETVPNEPFRIPRLSLEGQYQLDNIRLVEGDELLAYAEPRSAGVLVTQVLVTRVTSRALTLDEIRSYGIVVDEDRFRAFNFTFGFAVDGEIFDYNIPVIDAPSGVEGTQLHILGDPLLLGGSTGTTSPRFRPPRVAPFMLRVDGPRRGDAASGGCVDVEGCFHGDPVSLPGVILFPTDVSLLHQFFSVVVLAQNAAPAGDRLMIRDLTARVSLPPGLRLAETEPPTFLGVPVPIHVPGDDGRLGTADDLTFLVAQAAGQAEVLVEGRKQGTHVVEFDLEGVLEGLPDGELRRVSGHAKGAVVVRDPALGLTITHPDVVRVDEEYSLYLTVSNTSNAPVNLLSFTLPVSALSGVQVVGANSKSVPTLAPGEAEVVEFRLRSLRTGLVVASSIRAGSRIDPRFELAVGVGEEGIPLSPDAIILPKVTELLPPALVRSALGLVGLAYSLATAPSSALGSQLPQIGLGLLHEKVYWLNQAGRHVRLGEDLFDSAAILAAEWTGARNPDWEWDALRRRTQKGGQVGDSFAQILAAEAAVASPEAAFERFAATTAFLGPIQAALATGNGISLSVESRTSGKRLAGAGVDPARVRDLPFADLYDVGESWWALLAAPEAGGYRVRLEAPGGGAAGLDLLLPDSTGQLRVFRWNAVSLGPGGSAEVEYQPAASQLTLRVDADADGLAESEISGTETALQPRAFTALAAVQDSVVVTGHAIEVLFTQDVDLRQLLTLDPDRFSLPGKVSNGGLVAVEKDVGSFFELIAENPFEGLMDTRIVRVTFDKPVSPYRTHDLVVRDLDSVAGQALSQVTLPVQTTVTDPGAIVRGTVYGPDGQPVPFARVELMEVDFYYTAIISSPCQSHPTAVVEADAYGRFELDYVRQTFCTDLFTIRGIDPTSGHHGTARGRVRFVGEVMELDVLMLGRGTVRGRVTYEDGTVPEDLQVVGYSPVFYQGLEATYGADGSYEIRDLPVGTISLGASDRIGSFTYQTIEIPRAGAVVERNLTIIRTSPDQATGDVRGTVFATDGTTPIFDAYVALYVDGELVGAERSAFDGTFDFGTVRAGLAEIEAFEGSTGLSGAQLFFEVQPDQVNDITVLLRDERGAVEGRVYRQSLTTVTPVAGAVVWVSGTPFNTVTDETGFYRLEGVYAGSRTILAADLERQVQVSSAVTINSGDETVYRDLYFVESVGSGLAGEVVGFTGNPVSGATVHLATGEQWYREVYTNVEGRFVIPDLRPGTYEIHAFKGVSGAVARATIRFEGETPFVRVQFRKGTIRGTTRALESSGQIVGVRSLVTYRTTVVRDNGLVGLDYQAHTLETDESGNFEITDVLAGRYQLTVNNAFHGEKTARGELVLNGDVAQHDFLFEPNGRISGTVLDWDGATPVAGATVFLRHPSFGLYDLTSDEEGGFTFDLVPPHGRRFPIDAEIERDGVLRQARIWVAFTRNGQELDVEIVLPMQGTVTGWVEDAGGAAVPGAVVTLREHSYPNRQLIHNADSEGNFSFTNVFAGPVALSAQAPSLGGLGGRDSVEIIEEAQEVFSVIVLEATGEVTGRVLSPETGEVVPTAQVTLDRWLRGVFDSVTASAGEFRFRLLPLDLYRVRVFDPSTGRFGQSEWVSVDSNGHLVTVDVTLEARGDVDGHFYEPESGLGIPGATIRLQTHSLRSFSTYSSTDVDGYFEFLGIPEGSFTLSSKEPEGRRLASAGGEIVEEDERVTVDLYLEAVGVVLGSVLNPAGQAAGLFANANTLIYESGQVVGATFDNPFTFEGILTGRNLEIKAFENGGSHRGLAKGKLASGQSELTLDVRIVPLGSAAVTVEDSFGVPIAGADVRLYNSGFYGKKSLTASSGADGRAVFQGLGEGWISVSASKPGTVLKGSASGQLTLDGEQVEILLRLESSGSIAGRAVLSDGLTPAAEALVVVTVGSRTLRTLADGNGDFLFPSVPLGSYKVFVQEHFGPGTIERSGSIAANGEAVVLGTLVLDDHDPTAAAIEPATGSADLPLTTAVTIRFSEPLNPARWASGWVVFRKLGGGSVGYTRAWSEGDTLLTLTPTNPLASFTAYEVIVQDGYDLAGRRLSVKSRTTFNTADVLPPAVVDFLPRDGQNQVPVEASVLVTFSEPVAFDSLSGSAFQLSEVATGAGVTTTFQHLLGARQVLLTPASGLQSDRQYRLTVQGVRDNSGNTMAAPVTTGFWSVDTRSPEILSVEFPAGTTFVSGDAVPVVVTASDDWGLASAGLVIEDWSWEDAAEPWELTGVAPVVETPTTLTVQVSVTDVHGNVATVDQEIDVTPNPNTVPPVVADGCGRDGGYVVPGYAVELGPLATDDQAIESLALFVDGQELGRTSPVDLPEASAAFLWTPPAGATPGTSYLVRFEARDFAGNVGSAEVTVQVPPATVTVLTSGTTLFPSTYSGSDLLLARGTFMAPEPLSLSRLTVGREARILAPSGTGAIGSVELEVAAVLDVQCGGRIDASGAGYQGGRGTSGMKPGKAPEGLVPSTQDAGGSHGGSGAQGGYSVDHGGTVGEVFDSIYEPRMAGGGGAILSTDAGDRRGGDGGGVVEIQASGIEVDGRILALGETSPHHYAAGGAGGSVLVRVVALRGIGTIDASGGDARPPTSSLSVGGAGGGGRVAIHADQLLGFDPAAQAKAWGGMSLFSNPEPDVIQGYGAPGTILVLAGADANGRLIVDSGEAEDGSDRDGPATELPALGSGALTALETIGADAWVAAESPFRPRWVGAWMVLRDAEGTELGTFRVDELDEVGRVRLAGAGSSSGAATYSGEWRFDGIDLLHGAGLRASDPISGTDLVFGGEAEMVGKVVAETVVVKKGAVLRPVSGDRLEFSVAGTMTVEEGARIDVSGRGYAGGTGSSGSKPGTAPPWVQASQPNAGGSHGGAGTPGSSSAATAVGDVFDSVYEPNLSGGGGATSDSGQPRQFGGDGGGVVEILASEIVLEGEILARGESRDASDGIDRGAGGAGGSVRLRANSVSGSGFIDASGGDTFSYFPNGAGGGGRVAIHAGQLIGFDPLAQAKAWGGHFEDANDPFAGYAASGTILVKTTQDTYGRLIVDSGEEPDGTDRQGPATELPALGAGAVTGFEVSGADAWVTAAVPFRPRWLGAWMVLFDASGTELGAFRVAALDEAGRVLLEGAGTFPAPASYRGEYRFDRIDTLHGAGIDTSDPLSSATVIFEGDSEAAAEVVAETVVVKSGAVVRPAAGGSLEFMVSGTMTVEEGARIDVSGLGYLGGRGTSGMRPGEAPEGLVAPTQDAGGSHGGVGAKGYYAISNGGVLGEVYDSVYQAQMPGGGGAASSASSTNRGGDGGGVIEIVAGDLVLDGELLARGETRWARGGGGAGGSVSIRASSLTGTGGIDASGGDARPEGYWTIDGAGGGGRVSLNLDELLGFDPATQARVRGGARVYLTPEPDEIQGYAAPGTVFVETLGSVYGDLFVDQGGSGALTVPTTVLPSIGKGIVGPTAADSAEPSHLWIEDQDAAKLFSLGVVGMWVRIGGVDYPVLDQSADRRQLLLEGASGAVTMGDAYVGFYKFDKVTVSGKAHLELQDGDETATWVVEPGSSVTRFDLEPPVVAVTSPAAGALFVAGETVAIAADVTDPSGVASVTFRLGDQSFVDQTAPYAWSVAAPVVEVEQDVPIIIEPLDGNGNLGSNEHIIRVRPVAPGDPPVVAIGCPSPGVRLAPGTGLDFTITATHDDGVERVELLVGDDPTPVATDFAAPFELRYEVPLDAVEGEVVVLHFRARSLGGVYGEAVYPVAVIAANVVTGNAFLASTDTSLDGSSVVVAAGTLTIEGLHAFRDLVVLSGGTVTHPASTAEAVQRLELDLTRDLFVACGGSVDATGKGFPGGVSYRTAGTEAFYLQDDFDDGNIAGWQVVDEGEEGGPSNWSVSGGALHQTTNIVSQVHEGFGTSLVWPGALGAEEYRYSAFLRSTDDDRLGLLFRYVDAGNLYRFVWNRQTAGRLLEKVVSGQRITLAQDSVPYATSTWYLVEVVADGPRLEIWIDGQKVFDVVDATHPSGSVGVFSVANAGSYFDDIRVAPLESPSSYAGGSYGGRGGAADGSNRVYGSLFDPRDPGAGGGGSTAAAGGGVVRIAAAGDAVVDGAISARGATSISLRPSSAGGSIRLDATTVTGLGSIDASGGDGLSRPAAGGGGRIALYGAAPNEALLARTLAAGGDADTPERRGAAGTIFVKRDAQLLGDLILDNGGLDTAQPTELLAVLPGVVNAVDAASITDDDAEFPHDLTGIEVFFNGDPSTLWPIAGHEHRGQTLDLDTSGQALTALPGDAYEGLYRFDRVIVRGGAEAVTRSEVQSVTSPEVDAASSWVTDHQPSLTLTSPSPGQSFVSGATISVAAVDQDLFGASKVSFELGVEGFVDFSPPWAWSVRAPVVSAASTYEVTVVAVDRSGHELRDAVSVTVNPNSDPIAPSVALASCPADGDVVIPGTPLSLGFTVSDNELLESYRVLVDGAVVEEVSGVAQPSVGDSVSWAPPAGAAPGTPFTIRVEATDYAGNLGFDQWTLSTPAGAVLTGNQTLGGSWNGTDLTLGAGTFSVSEPLTLSALNLTSGSRLVAAAGTELDLAVTGALRIQCGGALDVSAQGYGGGHSGHPNGYGPEWVVPSSPDSGGSHGGQGTGFDVAGTAGEVYGSVYVPREAGAGGALRNTTDTAYRSGAGGGAVAIVAGSVVLEGEILARGEPRYSYQSAGAGGSVILEVAGSLSGAGRIDASGGDSTSGSSSGREGAGGGGRVALYAGSLAGFVPEAQVLVQGGAVSYGSTVYGYAAPGTVLVATGGASIHGDLIVDAGRTSGGAERKGHLTELPSLGEGAMTLFEPAAPDGWVTGSSAFRPRWEGAWMELLDGSGVSLGAFRVLEVDGSGRALLSGAGSVVAPASYRGEYRFDAVVLKNGAGLVADDLLAASSMRVEGTSRLPAEAAVSGDVTIVSGAVTSLAEGRELRLEVGGTLTVEAGGKLDVSALGYGGGHSGHPNGYGPEWVVPSSPDSGGSHGGQGTGFDVAGTAGEVYGSVFVPREAGAGGALRNTTDTAYRSGAGGGAVAIVAGSVVLEGEILARGEPRYSYQSAGAGGSVILEVAGSLSGAGRIDASGGDSTSGSSSGREGAGGGGRVALYAGSLAGFDPEAQVLVQGGAVSYSSTVYGYAAPGTVLVATDGASIHGDLIVDAGRTSGGAERKGHLTKLPSLGEGAMTLFEPAATDGWVTGSSAFRPRWEGAWMELLDGSGVSLGAFRVLEVDGSGRALLSGAGSVVAPASYRGEYRFDAVVLKNGAGLVADDRLAASSMRVEGTSRLPAEAAVSGDVTIVSGAVASLAEGRELRLEVGGTLTVEAGGKLDVSAQGYGGGHSGHPNGYGPEWVVPSSPDSGGSHGGQGTGFDVAGTVGEVYGSVFVPREAGAGGALRNTTDTAYRSGAGGGAVAIVAGSVVLEGEILARGEPRYSYQSAGAGGSVLLEVAGSLSGAGRIDASGGDSTSGSSSGREGAGGGGRVALYAGSLAGFDPEAQVLVQGGAVSYSSTVYGYAAPGTVLVATGGVSTYADLIVDTGASPSSARPNTVLPSAGTGMVGVADSDTTDPADLWIEPQDPAALFGVGVTGMWVRVDGSDYRVLDQSADRRRLLLEGAAGLVGVGDAYQGVYKFDTVTVRGGAVLEFLDTADVGTFDVDADSQVITPQ